MIDDKCWSRTDRWIIHDKWNHDEFSHECLTNDNERGQIIMSQWYPNPLLTRQVFVQPHVQRRPQSPSQHLSNGSLKRDKTLSWDSMTSWLIHRDPYNGVPNPIIMGSIASTFQELIDKISEDGEVCSTSFSHSQKNHHLTPGPTIQIVAFKSPPTKHPLPKETFELQE